MNINTDVAYGIAKTNLDNICTPDGVPFCSCSFLDLEHAAPNINPFVAWLQKTKHHQQFVCNTSSEVNRLYLLIYRSLCMISTVACSIYVVIKTKCLWIFYLYANVLWQYLSNKFVTWFKVKLPYLLLKQSRLYEYKAFCFFFSLSLSSRRNLSSSGVVCHVMSTAIQ